MINKEEAISQIKHFRNVSVYFYMVSFFMITIMFVFYLVGSKNNRGCQYGSTLFCNTEKFYYVGLNNTNNNYLEINFKQPTDAIPDDSIYTLQYPYSTADYYDIDYHFVTTVPSAVTTLINSDHTKMGISLNGTAGASIYFINNLRPEGITLNKITEFVISKSGIQSFKILTPSYPTPTNATMNYYYPTNNNTLNKINTPNISTNNKFFSPDGDSSVVSWSSAHPVKSNWINLLTNNKNQHKYGCSSGYQKACACIDPSYTSELMCDDLILNTDSGLYCPAAHPGCSVPCPVGNTEMTTNCGFRFCSSCAT